MGKGPRTYFISVITFLLLTCCAGKTSLTTQDIQGEGNIAGLYTLILYRSGASIGDLKSVAFLASEEEGYLWEPHAPSFEYTVTRHVSGQKAFQNALRFIRTSSHYEVHQIKRILDQTGKTIGYEVRPLFDLTAFGVRDIMTISYLLKERQIIEIYIDFLETVKRQVIGEY